MKVLTALLLQLLLPMVLRAQEFHHFEARHCQPISITPDGTRLLAVNSLEGRLSVFTIANPAVIEPMLIAEIPVGLEPVTVRARTNDEAWVVNELSDSITVVDLQRRFVKRIIPVPDEPADVVFAQGKAFISCGRANRLLVVDVLTFETVVEIPLQGVFPRAMAVSPDGLRVFVAFLLSGNNTTTLHFRKAPAQPAPTNPALPAPPQVGLIVPDTDTRISYDVLDHDVAEISTTTHEVIGYHGGMGTNLLALAMGPAETLWAAGSEARNLIRFEPNLKGVFAESRLAVKSIHSATGVAPTIHDLNPQAATAQVSEPDKALALAQPMALLADEQRGTMWMAAFGSDRIAELSATGAVIRRIDLRSNASPGVVRGPRGMAKTTARLYVANKLADTISIIDLATNSVVGEINLSSHDPMPAGQRVGRGFFFDSRRSGNGTVSCGACHFDADNDGIAWDLGDPGGQMQVLVGQNLSLDQPAEIERPVHPMKGPMVTQSLRGIKSAGPFHWRGDKNTIQEFNSSFSNLQAGNQLTAGEMDQVVGYLEAVKNHPNPNRNLDNSLKALVAGGNPTVGNQRFHQLNVCSKCHEGARGTNHVLDEFTSVLTVQPVKNATLEHSYKKVFFTPKAATSLSGFGFTHDGSGHDLPRGHEYDQDRFRLYVNANEDVTAFILSAETDTAPIVGHALVIRRENQLSPIDPTLDRTLLEAQATSGFCAVVVQGMIQGRRRSYHFDTSSGLYESDQLGESSKAFSALLGMMQEQEAVVLMAVPFGEGVRYSIDRNGDSLRNVDEAKPIISLAAQPASIELTWSTRRADWFPEISENLSDWAPHHAPLLLSSTEQTSLFIIPSATRGFFRVSRAW